MQVVIEAFALKVEAVFARLKAAVEVEQSSPIALGRDQRRTIELILDYAVNELEI